MQRKTVRVMFFQNTLHMCVNRESARVVERKETHTVRHFDAYALASAQNRMSTRIRNLLQRTARLRSKILRCSCQIRRTVADAELSQNAFIKRFQLLLRGERTVKQSTQIGNVLPDARNVAVLRKDECD